jgi:hypothetical protein
MLAEIATIVAKEAATMALEPLIRSLLAVQDEQLKRLESLHEDVRSLRDGPWRLANIYLREAQVAATPQRQEEWLQQTRAELYKAMSLSQGTAREAVIQANLAIVYGLLRQDIEARTWARGSFDAAQGYLTALAEEAQRLLRARPDLRTSLRNRALSLMPPSVEWLWWKNEVTSEDQIPPLRRSIGSQSYYVPLRLRLRPAIEAGRELPLDERQIGTALGLPAIDWLQAKTAVWTLQLPAIQRLYDVRRAYEQLEDYRQLCAAFGVPARRGRLLVDLSTHPTARVAYLRENS